MFGERLRLARKRAGLSLRALSDAIGGEVSAQGIGKYERGEMLPRSRVLLQLARVLDVTPDFLLSERVGALDGIEFRKKAATSARERAAVEAEVLDHVERYLAVEDVLGLSGGEWVPPVVLSAPPADAEAVEELAARVRERWGLGGEAVPDMTELLEENGLKVLLLGG